MIVVSQHVKRRTGSPLSQCTSVRKYDMPAGGWFHWLGFFTDCVVRQFDARATIEFEETRFGYNLTVRKLEEEK